MDDALSSYEGACILIPMAVTVKDVAECAGVSTATVSRVVNNDSRIADATRRKVLEAITSTGYRLNTVARSLKTRRTMTVGFLTPEIANLFFMNIAQGVEDYLSGFGFSLVICNTNERVAEERERIDFLIRNRVDGAIVIPSGRDGTHFAALSAAGIPCVIADRAVDGFITDTVVVDNEGGTYDAVTRIVRAGALRIGFIGGDLDLYNARERYQGFLRALRDGGVKPVEEIIRFGDFHAESGYRLMRELMESPAPPRYVFVCNYYMHMGATKYLVERFGNRTPDVHLASFDEMELSSFFGFTEVTVSQPISEIGRKAAEILLRRIEERRQGAELSNWEPEMIRLGTTLIEHR